VYEPAVDTTIDCAVSPVDQRLPVAEDEVSVMVLPAQKEAGPLMVGVVSAGVAATANGSEVAEQPLASVTVTVYEPAAETTIDCVVSPVDQRLPVPEDDVRVTVVPAQNDAGPVMVGVAGAGLAVTANAAEVAEQPPALLTVTVYEPAAETTIDCVVSPVDQRLPATDDEVSVMLLPAQKDDGPVMVGVAGAGFAARAKAAEVAEQPLASVTLTVYEPAAETMIDCVVSPVDQRLPVAEDEVNVAAPPAQKAAGPLMTGVAGSGLEVTAKGAEVALQPLASVKVTE
jgi:hypothetical protein